MPYIKEQNRAGLDVCIETMVQCIKHNVIPNLQNPYANPYKNLTEEEVLTIVGDINYAFSRILTGLMGDVSYGKIAIITGVLENIKQEFYRRVAEPYEEKKILQNGDIKEYKKLK
jgi:hypothetical protein